VAAARLKVLASLPVELRARAVRLVERFHLDAAAWYHADEPVPHLGTLSEAVWEAQRVEIGYDRGDKTVDRILEPLGLVLKAGVWYLVAGADGQPRTYRVSRVNRVRVLDERFDRPHEFDLAAFWTDSSSAYERDTPRLEVVLRVARERLDRLRDVIGERPYDTIVRLDDPDPDGWLRIRVKLDWPNEVVSQILAVGPDCELLEPAELRARIGAQAGRVAAHYAEPEQSKPPARGEPAVAQREPSPVSAAR
jgi:predicted DNA-binding transcriptional regulator YafY